MKKPLSLFLVFCFVCVSLCGCSRLLPQTGILGGMNTRNMGTYNSFVTDGQKTYWVGEIMSEHGYVEIGDDKVSLSEDISDEGQFTEVEPTVRALVWGQIDALSHTLQYAEGYGHLAEAVTAAVSEWKYYECIVLQNGETVYGAINCYTRTAGASGNLLANEDFAEAYILSVEDGTARVVKELSDMAVLALTQTDFIGYENRVFYSVNVASGDKKEICEDIWWDSGPTYYSYALVYFVDDMFMLCGNKRETDDEKHTLIVGKINGEYGAVLVDNEDVP